MVGEQMLGAKPKLQSFGSGSSVASYCCFQGERMNTPMSSDQICNTFDEQTPIGIKVSCEGEAELCR